MKLEELPDDFTPEQFMLLDKEALDKISYERKKWMCQCKKCENGTHVRDYGIAPFFFLDRNSKNANKKPQEYWRNLNFYYLVCAKHDAFIERLLWRFTREQIDQKLIDYSKMPMEKLIDAPRIVTNKINH